MRWIDNSGQFSFCNYSFVFDAGTKSKILQYESIVEQHHQRQEALRRTIFTGMVSAPALVFKIRREHLIQDTLSAVRSHTHAHTHTRTHTRTHTHAHTHDTHDTHTHTQCELMCCGGECRSSAMTRRI
jgi:hypothetical protein